MDLELRRITFRWAPDRGCLVATAELRSGQSVQVAFPLRHVEILFGQELAAEGVQVEPSVQGAPTTDRFCRAVEHLGRLYDREAIDARRLPVLGTLDLATLDDVPELGRRSRRGRIGRAFRRAVKRIGRRAAGVARRAIGAARSVLRSPMVASALRGAAMAVPAVGGPALAAYSAARRAERALSRGGSPAASVVRAARGLAADQSPTGRMLRSALQSAR